MAMRRLAPMAHDDDQLYELSKGMGKDYEPPEYPGGLRFRVSLEDLAACGCEGGTIGDTMSFSAMGTVTSIFKDMDGCRIELEVTQLAGEDGQFCDLQEPGHICLTDRDLEKMDLDDDCERGDMLHLIGDARLDSHSDTEWDGAKCVLQITDLSFVENESSESRNGGEG